MDVDIVKKDLLNTLEIIKVREIPVLIEEISHFFVNSEPSSPISNSSIDSKLKELQQAGQIFVNEEGFVSYSPNLSEEIKKRLDLEEHAKDRAKYAQKILKSLEKVPFIRFIGVIGTVSLGRIGKEEKIKLIIVVEKETAHLTKFIVNNYLKFRFAAKHFQIHEVREIDNLKWAKADAENGIKLLNLIPLVNRDKAYENFMAANNWIFDIFSNYPLEKVSWGFRIQKNIDNKVSSTYRNLNKFLSR